MSLAIPPLLRKPKTQADATAMLSGGVQAEDPTEMDNLKARFGYSRGADRPDTDDAAARAGVLSRGSVIGSMLEDPGADRRAADGLTPTRQQSQQEAEYLQAQVDPAVLAEQRRQEAIALEAQQIAMQQKLAAGEAARRFEEKYGVPADKDTMKFVMEAERVQEIEDDYAQKSKVLQSYLAMRVDGFGKPYTEERFAKDMKDLSISRGLALKAPSGYYSAVAPSENVYAGQPGVVAQSIQE